MLSIRHPDPKFHSAWLISRQQAICSLENQVSSSGDGTDNNAGHASHTHLARTVALVGGIAGLGLGRLEGRRGGGGLCGDPGLDAVGAGGHPALDVVPAGRDVALDVAVDVLALAHQGLGLVLDVVAQDLGRGDDVVEEVAADLGRGGDGWGGGEVDISAGWGC